MVNFTPQTVRRVRVWLTTGCELGCTSGKIVELLIAVGGAIDLLELGHSWTPSDQVVSQMTADGCRIEFDPANGVSTDYCLLLAHSSF